MSKKRVAARTVALAASVVMLFAGASFPAAAQGETVFSFTPEAEESVPVPDTGDMSSFVLPVLCLGLSSVFGQQQLSLHGKEHKKNTKQSASCFLYR